MNLLVKLIEKNLQENFLPNIASEEIKTFYVNEKKYILSLKHLNVLKTILKAEISNHFVIEDEKFTIAGGSVLTLIMYGSPFLIKDIDIFPCSQNDYDKLKLKLDKSAKLKSIDIAENKNSRNYRFKGIQVDLIKKFYPNTKECISNFDLSIVKMGFDQDFWFTSLVDFTKVFNFEMSMSKPIIQTKAFSILRRVMKYASKGFKVRPVDLIDLFATIKSNECSAGTLTTLEDGTSFVVPSLNYNKAFVDAVNESKEGYHALEESNNLNKEIQIIEF